MIEESLYTRLTGDGGIASIAADRIFALVAPAGVAVPRLIYSKVALYTTQTLCRTDSLERCSFQLDSYAKTYKDAKLLAKAVRACLQDFSGTVGDTRIASINLDSEIDLDDPDPGLYRVSQIYLIWYVES